MSGITAITEASMIAAHQAGKKYWERNRPSEATTSGIESLGRTCGWHGEDNVAFIAGFFGARAREAERQWRQAAMHYLASGTL